MVEVTHTDSQVVMVEDSDDEQDAMWWRQNARRRVKTQLTIDKLLEVSIELSHIQDWKDALSTQIVDSLGVGWYRRWRNGEGSLAFQVQVGDLVAQKVLLFHQVDKRRREVVNAKREVGTACRSYRLFCEDRLGYRGNAMTIMQMLEEDIGHEPLSKGWDDEKDKRYKQIRNASRMLSMCYHVQGMDW